jgi:hypothetical protein
VCGPMAIVSLPVYEAPRPKPETDDQRWARLHREVPSAFWLDPNLWGDAPAPTQRPFTAPIPPRSPRRFHRDFRGSYWQGRLIERCDYHAQMDLYILGLEGGEQVNLTPRMIEDMRL